MKQGEYGNISYNIKMSQIIDGKLLAQKIKGQVSKQVEELKKDGIIPKLAVIMIGQDLASTIYIKNKSKACREVGIEYEEFVLSESVQME